jgi:hypothetical protein
VRGALQPGEDVSSVVDSLRGLADALEAFANYRPGTYFDADEVRGRADKARGLRRDDD